MKDVRIEVSVDLANGKRAYAEISAEELTPSEVAQLAQAATSAALTAHKHAKDSERNATADAIVQKARRDDEREREAEDKREKEKLRTFRDD